MKLKKILAILVVCAVAMSAMVLPASARVGNSNFSNTQFYCSTAYHGTDDRGDLTREDTLKVYGIIFTINVTSAAEVGFGGALVANDPVGRWRDISTWSSPDGDGPVHAVHVDGTTYTVRFWSRVTQLFTEANFEGETYIEILIGCDWGGFNVTGFEYLDQSGAVIPKIGGGAPPPTDTPAPPPAPATIEDFDGTFKSSDALNILRIVAGLLEPTDAMAAAYDVNGDGDITSADALMVLQIVAGVIDAPHICDDDECDDDH
jgi:hypothetical protein